MKFFKNRSTVGLKGFCFHFRKKFPFLVSFFFPSMLPHKRFLTLSHSQNRSHSKVFSFFRYHEGSQSKVFSFFHYHKSSHSKVFFLFVITTKVTITCFFPFFHVSQMETFHLETKPLVTYCEQKFLVELSFI